MNQLNWTYLADNGKQHQVGVMHGPQSGHLLVHLNSKIILIDFSILSDKNYSFFIEEELCELTIEKDGDEFRYGFGPNKRVDTPLNQARKRESKKHLWQSLAFGATFLFVVVSAILGMNYFNAPNNLSVDKQLTSMGKETYARIVMSPDHKSKQVEYFFTVDSKPYTVETPFVNGEMPLFLENGMPLEVGDEFVITYLPNNPLLHRIEYDEPGPGTLEAYRSRTLSAYREKFPEASLSYSRCLTELAYEQQGVKGLAQIILNSIEDSEKPEIEFTFSNLLEDKGFLAAVNTRCE